MFILILVSFIRFQMKSDSFIRLFLEYLPIFSVFLYDNFCCGLIYIKLPTSFFISKLLMAN